MSGLCVFLLWVLLRFMLTNSHLLVKNSTKVRVGAY